MENRNCPVFHVNEKKTTLLGTGITGRVGDSVRGDERLASISSAMVNDVYNRRCLCEGVEPGCLQARQHKILIN